MIQCPKCSAENPPESRFCNSCGEELSSLSQAPTVAAPEGEAPPSPVEAPHVGRIVSSDSIPAGGFTPGTILADRYRIIGLLGRGGMGEVYRADDLKLGQPVALKFLPPKLSDDPVRRERFFAEVRITRQLSHPNICRVYDIGEVDGRHFLSMEYIDGEDLASLMKRIGSLTNEKALDIARQLVAGLSVAHERGVLHRDLKPANIMLDGHGRVRITDFGLAIAAEDESQAEEIAGTPAYMAPEQLAGKGATVRSDIYSLGLILYEIYTGKKAFKAMTLAELREQKETQTPRAPSELRDGIDPVVERVIQRCMEKDPNSRPASVAQLAQALPGGDPLAAAIAAGETPSPEMVAASGSKEGLRPAIAWGLLVFMVVGCIVVGFIKDRKELYRRISLETHPEALVKSAREIIKKAGYTSEPADSVYGFVYDNDLLNYLRDSEEKTDRQEILNSKGILFWYRQSPRKFEIQIGEIEPDNPPLQFSGEILVVLDAKGELELFRVEPLIEHSLLDSPQSFKWETFFFEAGLIYSDWTRSDIQWDLPSYTDTTAIWLPKAQNIAARIEGGAYRGKAVYFKTIYPWTLNEQSSSLNPRSAVFLQDVASLIYLLIIVIGGIFFARTNLRRGRGDRRGAMRLALFIIGLFLLRIILSVPHISISDLLKLPYIAGLFWILYIAIEPYVRRRWPQVLVSWTRLLSGEWRDPLVARDIFIGCTSGILLLCIFGFMGLLTSEWSFFALSPTLDLTVMLGLRNFISALANWFFITLMLCFGFLSLLLFMRVLLRNQKAAFFVTIIICVFVGGGTYDIGVFLMVLIGMILFLVVLMRYGFVALIFSLLTAFIFFRFPITLDASIWYSDYGFAALIVLAAIVLYAFYYSLGGRPMFGTPRLDE